MFLLDLAGCCGGTNNWILGREQPRRSSAATAPVTPDSRGRVVRLDYTWDEGGPQEGMLPVGARDGPDGVLAAWIDSWHMGSKLMLCRGDIDASSLRLFGTYTAPPGPDWGWRIVIKRSAHSASVLQMFNIAPDDRGRWDGEGDLAVETHFHSVGKT